MSRSLHLSTQTLHAIEEALNWGAGEAHESARYCNAQDAAALTERAEGIETLIAEVHGVLRARQVAGAGKEA